MTPEPEQQAIIDMLYAAIGAIQLGHPDDAQRYVASVLEAMERSGQGGPGPTAANYLAAAAWGVT